MVKVRLTENAYDSASLPGSFPQHIVNLGITGHVMVSFVYFLKYTLCYALWSAHSTFCFVLVGHEIREVESDFRKESLGITCLF